MSPSLPAPVGSRLPRLSVGTVAMAMVGLALYQMTSLELGPRAHDFQVNLTLETPLVQDVAEPVEQADALVGQISLALHSTPPPVAQTVVRRAPPARYTAPTVMAVIPIPVITTNQPVPLPIIGRCQNRWTGLLSAMWLSSALGRGPAGSPCSEAVVRD